MKPIRGIGTEYLPYMPYWKGHDQEGDETLSRELFHGRAVRDGAGKRKTDYLRKDSDRERLARDALTRLLMYHARNSDAQEIISWLCCALRNDGGTDRRIVLEFRKKKEGDRLI